MTQSNNTVIVLPAIDIIHGRRYIWLMRCLISLPCSMGCSENRHAHASRKGIEMLNVEWVYKLSSRSSYCYNHKCLYPLQEWYSMRISRQNMLQQVCTALELSICCMYTGREGPPQSVKMDVLVKDIF